MTRAALLAAGLLTLAACSGGSDAEPPPPLDTEAPTTTAEASPTTEAPEATTTSTTTTLTPETTTTTASTVEAPVTEAAINNTDAVDRDAIFGDAFSAYETAWETRRTAIRQPDDAALRAQVNDSYIGNERLAKVNEFLDSRAAASDQIVEDPESPSSLEFIEGVFVTQDGAIAQFLVCETLRDDVVDSSGATTFSENISYRNQVVMELDGGKWKVQLDSSDEEFENAETCT